MGATVRPFLRFHGNAEAAISFWVSLIPDSRILDIRVAG